MPEPGTDMPRAAMRPAEELAAELGELRVENERLRAVLRALARTNSELDLDAALEAILDCACEVFGADHSVVLLGHAGAEERTVRMARGLSERYLAFLAQGVLPLQPVAERGQPFSVRDLVEAPPLPVPQETTAALRAEGIRGVTVLILRQGQQVTGVLVLYFDQPRELSPEELLVAQSFADQCAMAIGKAHEYETANRLRAEREASEQRLQAILDCLRDLVIVWNPAMEVMVANASAQAMLDAGLEVMHCFLALPDECPVRRVLQTGRPLHGCELNVGTRVFEVDAYPLLGPAGEVTAVVQHARDVTENRRLQRALERSEERLRLARDLAPVGLLQLDAATGRIVQANRTMGNYCARDASELVGLALAELFGAEEARYLPPLWDEVLRTSRAAHDGVHLLRAIGGAVPVSLTFGSLEFSDGQRYVQCIVKDISARLRLQAQLVEQEKLAAIGQLASGVAHEIRNPLNTIGSALFDLDEILQCDDPEVREDLTIARDEIARVQEIINAVLDFARAGSSEREWFDLRQLVEQTVALLRKSMATRDVELDLALDPVPPIHAERGGIRQVALNLLTNGYQATPDGGRIGIRLWQADDETIALSISDTGQGIPADQLGRIFNPFYTTKAPGEGTGLGLSIVYTTIQRHGGEIHVESTPGRGTTFHIRLPREAAEEPVSPTPLTAAAEELLGPPPPV